MKDVAAILFISLVACIPLFTAAIWMRSSPYNSIQSIFCFLATVMTRLQWRAQMSRDLAIRANQGAVLLSNHRSSIDPFFVQVTAGRVVHWMVAREYCEHPAFRWFLNACEVIPVNRGGVDTASTKLAIRLAQRGGVIGMFPEGRINMSDAFMMPSRPGAILIALRANVPIVPIYIDGSPYGGTPWSPFFMRASVRVRVGEPIDLSVYQDRDEDHDLTSQIMLDVLGNIAELAGVSDHRPTLAGRRWKPTESEIAEDVQRLTER